MLAWSYERLANERQVALWSCQDWHSNTWEITTAEDDILEMLEMSGCINTITGNWRPLKGCPISTYVSSSVSSSSSSFPQVVGSVPWLRQHGDGWLSRRGGSCLGISPPGIQEDAVLRKPLRHVLQPQQPPGSLSFPAWLIQPGRDQPGVSKRARWSSGRLPPPSHATVSSAAAAVLDITTPKEMGLVWIDINSVSFFLFFPHVHRLSTVLFPLLCQRLSISKLHVQRPSSLFDNLSLNCLCLLMHILPFNQSLNHTQMYTKKHNCDTNRPANTCIAKQMHTAVMCHLSLSPIPLHYISVISYTLVPGGVCLHESTKREAMRSNLINLKTAMKKLMNVTTSLAQSFLSFTVWSIGYVKHIGLRVIFKSVSVSALCCSESTTSLTFISLFSLFSERSLCRSPSLQWPNMWAKG